MLFNIRRAGAAASAAMIMIVTVFATEGSGANAQMQTQPVQSEFAAEITNTGADAQDPASQIRFVASEVVQELPVVEEAPADITPSQADTSLANTSQAESLSELVAEMPAVGALSSELQCLAQAVYFESRGEPLAGQLAVAKVIINRSKSGQFPGTYCSVITQPAQFSFVRGGRIPAANTSTGAWQRAQAIARIAHEDLWDSAARDSLYFHANSVRPRWARQKVARATIDSHIFYR